MQWTLAVARSQRSVRASAKGQTVSCGLQPDEASSTDAMIAVPDAAFSQCDFEITETARVAALGLTFVGREGVGGQFREGAFVG